MQAYMCEDDPGLVRYSAIVRSLKAKGQAQLAHDLAAEVKTAGRTCATHGLLDDPVIGIDPVGVRVVVGCPWCSGVSVLKAWTEQGTEARA